MKCPKCSNDNRARQAFCGACGAELVPESIALRPSVSPARDARPPKHTSIATKVLFGVLLLGLGGPTRELQPSLAAVVSIALVGMVALLWLKKVGPRWLRTGGALIAVGSLLGTFASFQGGQRRAEDDRAAAAVREEQSARIPQLVSRVKSMVAARQWEEAAASYAEIESVDSEAARTLSAEAAQIRDAVKRIEDAKRIADRKQQLALAMTRAQKLAKDSKACEGPLELSNIWEVLGAVTRVDAEYTQAKALVPRLEQCRKSIERP